MRTWLQTQVALRSAHWWAIEHRRAERWLAAGRRYRWIFILGCNNSGTTLLYRLLGNHPDVVPVSPRFEGTKLTWMLPRAPSTRRLFTEKLELLRRTEASAPTDAAHLMYDWLRDKRDLRARFILEKSPRHTLSARWLQTMFPGAFFIGLVRNGYAVAEGIRRRVGCSIHRAALHWNNVNKIMMEDAPHLHRFHVVTYEQLALDSEQTMRELARFLALEFAPFEPLLRRSWAVHNADREVRTISDFNQGSLRRLSAEEIATVTLTAREMLERFGYCPAGDREAAR